LCPEREYGIIERVIHREVSLQSMTREELKESEVVIMCKSGKTGIFENGGEIKKMAYAIAVLVAFLISVAGEAAIVLPYVQDFDDMEVGSVFADWDWDPVGEVLGPGSTPFGQTVPFSGNYLFLTGSEAQGTVAFLEESRSTLGFSLDFYSLPNPRYEAPGTFAGGLSFSISDSRGGRQGWIIGDIDGDMSQDPDELEVTLRVLPLDSLPGTTIEIGSIRHGEIYNLDVGLNENIVNVFITGPSTSIHYEYVIPGETLLADRIAIGQGGYPGDEYGVAIDNISVIPEPCTLALLALGASVLMRKTNARKVLLVVLAFFWLVFSQVAHGADPSEQVLHMGSPVGFGEFDAGGYSDWYYWGQSPRHGYEYHEMLSGEWAAAIYYDGIATGNQAMWLTDYFLWPNWENFDNDFTVTSCSSWDDPSPPGNPISPNYNAKDHAQNPVTAYDTGQSVIQNGQVRITIDYEMVDLGEQVPGSPMAFGSLVGADAFVYSERYVLLQTYTIKNKTASPIENLEFYQMLHGHPAEPVLEHPENQTNPVVFSVYDSTDHADPLEAYEPFNDVHCAEGSIYAGKFRYDITQWNNLHDPDKHPQVDHRDWIGFSSTVEPDFIENGYYVGGHFYVPEYKPPEGTHISIEERSLTLDGETYSFGEVAGAMGWILGTLAPDDSVKLTLAIMFGAGPIQKTCQPFEPIAYWGLDEGSGAIAHDSIGDNDGTLVGDPEWVAGFHAGALEFDGYGDYVKLDHGVGALTGDSVTISAWVNPTASVINGTYYDVFSQTKGDSMDLYGYSMYLSVDGSGVCKPGFSLRYPGCNVVSSVAIGKNDWSWVVGTNDGSTLTLYVDGVSAGSVSSVGCGGVYADAFIGGHVPGESDFLGVIDDVRVLACAWDGEAGCLPYCDKGYFDWVLFGRPDCWCHLRQCRGDADGKKQGSAFAGYTYVSTDDLAVLIDAWQVKEPPKGPGIATIPDGICADFNHRKQGSAFAGYMRVGTDDLGIMIASWQVKEPPHGPGITGDCLECDGGGESARGRGTSEQVTSKELLDWLAEIWLDPQVRERIDAEAWLRLYESLKE